MCVYNISRKQNHQNAYTDMMLAEQQQVCLLNKKPVGIIQVYMVMLPQRAEHAYQVSSQEENVQSILLATKLFQPHVYPGALELLVLMTWNTDSFSASMCICMLSSNHSCWIAGHDQRSRARLSAG